MNFVVLYFSINFVVVVVVVLLVFFSSFYPQPCHFHGRGEPEVHEPGRCGV